jgi:hypothetical protein
LTCGPPTFSATASLDRLGYTGKLAPVLVFNRIRVYLACNRAVPDVLVGRMNSALDVMEGDGTARHREQVRRLGIDAAATGVG